MDNESISVFLPIILLGNKNFVNTQKEINVNKNL